MKQLMKPVARALMLISLLVFEATAATWDSGGGTDKAWTNTANWANDPATWPGQSGDTETVATLSGGLALVDVNLQGGALNTLNVGNSATLRVESGAVLPSANLSIDPWVPTGNGATFEINDGTWTNSGIVIIGRWANGPSDRTSTFRMNGGVYTNTNSAGRVDQGHGDNRGLSLAQFNGGNFSMAGAWNMAGNTDGRSRLEFAGGAFRTATLNAGSGDASDGFQAEIRVMGSGATSINPVTLNLYRHASNATGRSWINFIADAAGVTPVTTTNLNLGTTAGRQGELQVDLSNYHPGIAGNTLVLFTYANTKLTGTFGAINVILGENTLSYELNYAYQGNKIALVNMTHVPLQVETRPSTGATDTTANLVGAINYVDAGGAELWIYYGPVDGGNVAGNWQSSVRVGGGLTAGEHTVQVANLTADSRYYYRVYATHGATSVWADASQVFGTRFAASQAPANLTAQGGWDKVALSWGEEFNSETGFVIQRATDANFTANVASFQVAGVNAVSAVDLKPDTEVTVYYRVAAVNGAGQSGWSNVVSTLARASQETIANLTLTQSTVFDLQEETRKRALRGTREATIKATIGGIEVPLATTNAFRPDNYGAPTDSAWYIDPYLNAGTTQFLESYAWSFNFGNGVIRDLDLVPIRITKDSTSRDHILLNLAFKGTLTLGGTEYLVEVVQGASPSNDFRYNYPGYFNHPDVSVMLYNAATGVRVESMARLKQIGGTWYSFESNPSGEKLTVKRINATGTMVLNAGAFQKPDLGFVNGSFSGPNGWQIDMGKIDFTGGSAVLPAGTYTFPEFTIRNNGVEYTIIWHSYGSGDTYGLTQGSFTVPADGSATFYVGRSATVRIHESSAYYRAVHGYDDAEALDIFMLDEDQRGAIIPNFTQACTTGPNSGKKNQGRIASYTNSAGGAIQVTKWNPHMCGWNGNWIWSAELKDSYNNIILGIDPNPPAVFDTRTVQYSCELPALYGQASGSKTINVRNEGYSLHARYYDFDEALPGYPDFDALRPDRELSNARMAYTPTSSPWADVAALSGMSDTFAARYDFEITFKGYSNSNATTSTFTFKLQTQGYARLYIDDQLIVENTSPNAVTETQGVYKYTHGERPKARLEYYHNSGDAALSLAADMFTAPYYNMNFSFSPDDQTPGYRFRAMNPAVVPPAMQVTSPALTSPLASVGVTASHPDGAVKVECFVDGVKVATASGAPYTFDLSGLPVGAKVDLRYTDPFGFGHLSPVASAVLRESLADWLARHGLSSGSGDADSDGLSNAVEYNADTNPLDRQSGLRTSGSSMVPESSAMRIQWAGVTTASPAVSHYQIQSSTDLIQWNPYGDPIPLNATGQYSADCDMGGDSKCFFRIISVPR